MLLNSRNNSVATFVLEGIWYIYWYFINNKFFSEAYWKEVLVILWEIFLVKLRIVKKHWLRTPAAWKVHWPGRSGLSKLGSVADIRKIIRCLHWEGGSQDRDHTGQFSVPSWNIFIEAALRGWKTRPLWPVAVCYLVSSNLSLSNLTIVI